MSRSSRGSSRINAAMIMTNVTAFSGGILSAVMFLGPSFQAAHQPFVDYTTEYYGGWTALPATLFLFCLMAVMIAGLTTIIIHTLIDIVRTKVQFFKSFFNFGKKGNYYD